MNTLTKTFCLPQRRSNTGYHAVEIDAAIFQCRTRPRRRPVAAVAGVIDRIRHRPVGPTEQLSGVKKRPMTSARPAAISATLAGPKLAYHRSWHFYCIFFVMSGVDNNKAAAPAAQLEGN
jgi:hypothetical protein